MAAAVQSTKPQGKFALVATVAALTLLAALGGGLSGKMIVAKLHAMPTVKAADGAAPPRPGEDLEMQELPPIITNLASPSEARVRLQVAIVFPKHSVEMPSLLAARIADDLVAYVKTLTIGELQGASGLQALREDLTDRAKTRSDGKVRELMIENLVVQ